jgi:hypothetical protein
MFMSKVLLTTNTDDGTIGYRHTGEIATQNPLYKEHSFSREQLIAWFKADYKLANLQHECLPCIADYLLKSHPQLDQSVVNELASLVAKEISSTSKWTTLDPFKTYSLSPNLLTTYQHSFAGMEAEARRAYRMTPVAASTGVPHGRHLPGYGCTKSTTKVTAFTWATRLHPHLIKQGDHSLDVTTNVVTQNRNQFYVIDVISGDTIYVRNYLHAETGGINTDSDLAELILNDRAALGDRCMSQRIVIATVNPLKGFAFKLRRWARQQEFQGMHISCWHLGYKHHDPTSQRKIAKGELPDFYQLGWGSVEERQADHLDSGVTTSKGNDRQCSTKRTREEAEQNTDDKRTVFTKAEKTLHHLATGGIDPSSIENSYLLGWSTDALIKLSNTNGSEPHVLEARRMVSVLRDGFIEREIKRASRHLSGSYGLLSLQIRRAAEQGLATDTSYSQARIKACGFGIQQLMPNASEWNPSTAYAFDAFFSEYQTIVDDSISTITTELGSVRADVEVRGGITDQVLQTIASDNARGLSVSTTNLADITSSKLADAQANALPPMTKRKAYGQSPHKQELQRDYTEYFSQMDDY